MTQHIGIVACSAEGAALCYRTICAEGEALLGTHAHPEVSLHTHSLATMAVSSLKKGLLPMTQTAMRFEKVAYHDYEGVVLEDAAASPHTDAAIDEGYRAVQELLLRRG